MALTEQEKRELLSFNTGEPIVVTTCDSLNDYDEYSVIVFIRTITDPTPQYIKSVQLKIVFSKYYPNDPPIVRLFKTRLFHPNFSANGIWLCNAMRIKETISDYLMRLVRTMQFKEIDVECVADRNAMAWYNKMKSNDIFPTDKINYAIKPRISVIKINDRAC